MRPDAPHGKRGRMKKYSDETEAALARKDADELRSIAVTVLGSNDVSVTRDDTSPTSFTDVHGAIVVTDQIIPKQLRDKQKALRRVIDGEVLHEAGHNIVTRAIVAEIKKFVDRHRGLGQYVQNLYEDKRVNHFVEGRYTYDDYAGRLKYLRDITGQCWKFTALEDLKSGKLPPGQAFASALGMSLLYEQDADDIIDLLIEKKAFPAKAMRDDMAALHEIGKQYRFIRTEQRAMELLERVVTTLKKYTEDMPELIVPRAMHGKADLRAPGSLCAEVEHAEHEDSEHDEDEDQADDGCDDLHNFQSTSRGLGDGLEIPAPTPDFVKYQQVRDYVEPQVQRLLNLLKKLMQVRSTKEDWQRSGRIMYPVLPQAVAASHFGPVENIYSKTRFTIEKEKVVFCMLVDLSGSMDQIEAQRVLATITEVCGRWLRDEDFSILTYGCFPAGTEAASTSPIRAVSKRWYSGDMVTITAGGASVRATANHPFLTQRGWVEAKYITTDDFIYRIVGDHGSTPKQMVAEAPQMAVAGQGREIRLGAQMDGRRPAGPSEYVADLQPGEAGVGPEEKLRTNRDESEGHRSTETGHQPLPQEDDQIIEVEGRLLVDGVAVLRRDNRRRGEHQLHPEGEVRDAPTPNHPDDEHEHEVDRMGLPQNWVEVRSQQGGDGEASCTVPFSGEWHEDSADVAETASVLNREAGALSAHGRIHFEPIDQIGSGPSVAERGGNRIENPHVECAKVSEVETAPFSGSVFNLETEDHTYFANGFLVHNSGFQRVKVHVESYHNTRARIGGLHDMGGTMALPPTIACHRMLNGIDHRKKKVFIFVSDFYIEPVEEMQKEWKSMGRDGIDVLGVCLTGDGRHAKAYLGDAVRSIHKVDQLPEVFFEMYRDRVAFKNVELTKRAS